jgi:hypothetical protein
MEHQMMLNTVASMRTETGKTVEKNRGRCITSAGLVPTIRMAGLEASHV